MSGKTTKAKRRADKVAVQKEAPQPVLIHQASRQRLHIRKFENIYGESARSAHIRLGVAQKCHGCSAPGEIVIRSLCAVKDYLAKATPAMQALMVAVHGIGKIPNFPTKYGPCTIINEIAVCARCRPAAERAAAKLPSWVIVEIRPGPAPAKIVSSGVGLPSSILHH